jgi:hypothetical protein
MLNQRRVWTKAEYANFHPATRIEAEDDCAAFAMTVMIALIQHAHGTAYPSVV